MSGAPDKKKEKKKKGKKGDAAATGTAVSVSAHPRARASIRRTRARTALVAFGIVLFLSLDGGVSGQEAAMRALLAGLVGNLAGWACALAVWRQIVVQEVRLVEDNRRERARARAEAAAARAEAAAAS
jgi:hypothetical protein